MSDDAPKRHHGRSVTGDRPPTLDEIRAARDTISRLLYALSSGKHVLVPHADFAEVDRLRSRQVWMMECLACHAFGTPMRPDETTCGNCGNMVDTRMWFRYL